MSDKGHPRSQNDHYLSRLHEYHPLHRACAINPNLGDT